MARMIFPNLPVADVARARAFWDALGFEFNDDFSSDEAVCLVISELASVMLLQSDYFHSFHSTSPHTGTEALICITAESPAEVDELCAKAAAAGAVVEATKIDDGPMYGGTFHDLDGHIWEIMSMSMG